MPLVAAALSDSLAAEATTSSAGVRTSAMRPTARVKRFAFMSLPQNVRWKRKPIEMSSKLMNWKLSSR